jgi:hypothetical protein
MTKACKAGEDELIDWRSSPGDLWDRLQLGSGLGRRAVIRSAPSSVWRFIASSFRAKVYQCRAGAYSCAHHQPQRKQTANSIKGELLRASKYYFMADAAATSERAPNFPSLLKNFVVSLELRAGSPKRSPELASTSTDDGKVATKSKKF